MQDKQIGNLSIFSGWDNVMYSVTNGVNYSCNFTTKIMIVTPQLGISKVNLTMPNIMVQGIKMHHVLSCLMLEAGLRLLYLHAARGTLCCSFQLIC